jgi:hypothetical protein
MEACKPGNSHEPTRTNKQAPSGAATPFLAFRWPMASGLDRQGLASFYASPEREGENGRKRKEAEETIKSLKFLRNTGEETSSRVFTATIKK